MNVKEIIEQKKEWNDLKKRIKKLPDDYQFVYKEMQKYLFKVCIMNEEEVIEVFSGLLELFEDGVIQGKKVLDITGEDVAEFCDNLIIDKTNYMDLVNKEVEQTILKKYKKK